MGFNEKQIINNNKRQKVLEMKAFHSRKTVCITDLKKLGNAKIKCIDQTEYSLFIPKMQRLWSWTGYWRFYSNNPIVINKMKITMAFQEKMIALFRNKLNIPGDNVRDEIPILSADDGVPIPSTGWDSTSRNKKFWSKKYFV